MELNIYLTFTTMDILRHQSDIGNQTPMPTERLDETSVVNTSTSETVVWMYSNSGTWAAAAAQAAGTICTFQTKFKNIQNSINTTVGHSQDTSLSFAAATRASTLVDVPEDVFYKMQEMSVANQVIEIAKWLDTAGDYAIDHRRGQLWLKSLATVANDAVTYDYRGSSSSTAPIYVKEVSAGTDIVVQNATGTAAINTTTAIAAEFKLIMITCHFSAAPTTSENFQVKLDSVAGSAYDTVLYAVNPSLSSATDLVYLPDGEMKFKTSDELVVTFTNTETRTYGLSIYYQLI
jgi:hypothetical protein